MIRRRYLSSVQPLQLLLLGLPPRCFLDPACQLGIQLFVRVGFLVERAERRSERTNSLTPGVRSASARRGEERSGEEATEERRKESGLDLVEGEERH